MRQILQYLQFDPLQYNLSDHHFLFAKLIWSSQKLYHQTGVTISRTLRCCTRMTFWQKYQKFYQQRFMYFYPSGSGILFSSCRGKCEIWTHFSIKIAAILYTGRVLVVIFIFLHWHLNTISSNMPLIIHSRSKVGYLNFNFIYYNQFTPVT